MKKTRFFLKRSQKIVLSGQKNQIIIPFRPLTIVTLFVLIFVSAFLLLRSDMFIIHKVQVLGAEGCINKEQLTQNIDLLGRSIFFADLSKSKKNAIETFPCLGELSFRKKFPDLITVELNLRNPVALVHKREEEATISAELATASAQTSTKSAEVAIPSATGSAKIFFLVDKEGVLFAYGDENSHLPRVETPQLYNLDVGKRIENKPFRTLLDALVESASLGISITVGKIEDGKITIVTNEGIEVIMADKKDGSFYMESLQAILTQAKIEGVVLEKIDFSFEKPVITTRKK